MVQLVDSFCVLLQFLVKFKGGVVGVVVQFLVRFLFVLYICSQCSGVGFSFQLGVVLVYVISIFLLVFQFFYNFLSFFDIFCDCIDYVNLVFIEDEVLFQYCQFEKFLRYFLFFEVVVIMK